MSIINIGAKITSVGIVSVLVSCKPSAAVPQNKQRAASAISSLPFAGSCIGSTDSNISTNDSTSQKTCFDYYGNRSDVAQQLCNAGNFNKSTTGAAVASSASFSNSRCSTAGVILGCRSAEPPQGNSGVSIQYVTWYYSGAPSSCPPGLEKVNSGASSSTTGSTTGDSKQPVSSSKESCHLDIHNYFKGPTCSELAHGSENGTLLCASESRKPGPCSRNGALFGCVSQTGGSTWKVTWVFKSSETDCSAALDEKVDPKTY